jgi:uncharacterized glyoxalase superfamily protein PhnB
MSARVSVTLGYRDAARAIEFLVTAFGFEKVVVYEVEPNVIGHAELRWPGGGLVMLHSAAPGSAIADITAKASAGYPPFAVHVSTDEPDALFSRAVSAGAEVVRPIADSPRGTRDFIVKDPEGLCWSFGTPLPELVRDAGGEYKPAHQ